jgi:hypothetical protein
MTLDVVRGSVIHRAAGCRFHGAGGEPRGAQPMFKRYVRVERENKE